MSLLPIHIIGGGVGGLALGIRLCQLGLSARISEAGCYPRHRVCGEFISGKGIGILEKLDLLESLKNCGAQMAHTLKFYGVHTSSSVLRLPQPALCISRYVMDHVMSARFTQLGGKLHVGQRYSVDGNPSERLVLATGRRPEMNRRSAWVGYKFHLKNLHLEAYLEMHFNHQGYLGLCRIEGDKINVCGLFKPLEGSRFELKSNWLPFLKAKMNSQTHQALASARILENSVCIVSGLSYPEVDFHEQSSFASIGDRAATIPPLTGNGMSMALESAWSASKCILEYHRGELTWPEVISSLCDAGALRFRKRLAFAIPIQNAIFSNKMGCLRESLIKRLSFFHSIVFGLTR